MLAGRSSWYAVGETFLIIENGPENLPRSFLNQRYEIWILAKVRGSQEQDHRLEILAGGDDSCSQPESVNP